MTVKQRGKKTDSYLSPIKVLLILLILLICLIIWNWAVVFAAEEEGDSGSGSYEYEGFGEDALDSPHTPRIWPSVLRVLLLLPVVLLLAYVTSRLIGSRVSRSGGAGGLIEVLEVRPLAHKKYIYVLGLGRRVLVLGGTPENLSLIAELEREEYEAMLAANEGGKREFSFRQQLRSYLENLKWKEGRREDD